MPHTHLTDKERDAVKQEWYERIELELRAEPTLADAMVLITNMELTRKCSDIHQRGATCTAILAEVTFQPRLKYNWLKVAIYLTQPIQVAFTPLAVHLIIEHKANQMSTGSQTWRSLIRTGG